MSVTLQRSAGADQQQGTATPQALLTTTMALAGSGS